MAEQVDGRAPDAEQRIENELEVAEVFGEEIRVGGRRVAGAEAAPVERDHVALLGERVDDELERCGDIHPAVQHHQRRAAGTIERRVAPDEDVLAQAPHLDESAARRTPRCVGKGAGHAPHCRRAAATRLGRDCDGARVAASLAKPAPARGRIVRMTSEAAFSLRSAEPRDVDAITALIRGLAEFEKLTHLLEVTPDKLALHLFGAKPVVEAVVAERAGRVVAFALFFTNFSTFLAKPGLYLEDLFVAPDQRGQGIGQALLDAPRAPRRLARLRPLRVERARLERGRDPLLPAHGRDGDARLAHLPDRRPGARRVPEHDAVSRTIDSYAELHASFRWHVPERFNIADVCCTRWARERPDAIAIRFEDERGQRTDYTYGALDGEADRLAAALRRLGVARGDRVALVLPQRFETAVAHIALYRLGAVAMPLSMLFGPDALEYRFQDSEARLAIVDESGIANVREARPLCPGLATVVAVGGAEGQGDVDWSRIVAAERGGFVAESTRADDPAVLIYTSGTTGPPKGALIPHRALIGNLPGFVCSQNWFPQHDAVFLVTGRLGVDGRAHGCALADALLRARDRRATASLRARDRVRGSWSGIGVTHTFLFPTALKAMMKAVPAPRERFALSLRAIMSAGEAVGDAVFAWCRDALGVVVNEMFGQTEINYIVGNCAVRWPARPAAWAGRTRGTASP